MVEGTVWELCFAHYHYAQLAVRKWALTVRARSAVESNSHLKDAALFHTGPGIVRTIFTVAAEAASQSSTLLNCAKFSPNTGAYVSWHTLRRLS